MTIPTTTSPPIPKASKTSTSAPIEPLQGLTCTLLLKQSHPKLAERIREQLSQTEQAIAAIPRPIDREVLGTPPGSAGRQAMGNAIHSLQQQAQLFKQAKQALVDL